jgi:hypothetical protein
MLLLTIKWFSKLSRLGINKNHSDNINRRIIFSNIVFLCLPVVYLVFMAIDYKSYLKPIYLQAFDQYVIPIIILVCIAGLILNKYGLNLLSRITFIVLWPILLHHIPIILLKTPLDYSIAYPFGLVFHAILIQLMISHSQERLFFGSLLTANILLLVFLPSTLNYFDTDKDLPEGLIDYKYYYYDCILYWLLFNLLTFYILFVIERYIKKLNDSKVIIERQKNELHYLNQSLETIIAQRTAELQQQNEKLKNHAHYNAHLLRGPFCRVQGLIQIQELIKFGSNEMNEIKKKLDLSLLELDTRIREIQNLVETEELVEE